jgi:hypothetical protein
MWEISAVTKGADARPSPHPRLSFPSLSREGIAALWDAF